MSNKTNIWTGPQLMRFNASPSKYALKFDGVNDYLQSTIAYNQLWNYKDQPISFFLRLKNWPFTTRQEIFLHLSGVVTGGRGIICEVMPGNALLAFRFIIRNNFSSNDCEFNVSNAQMIANLNGVDDIIQFTYNGIPNLSSSADVRINGTTVTKTLRAATLTTQPIVNALIHFGSLGLGNFLNATFRELSFSNFVKSPTELTNDFQAGMDLTANPLSPTYDPSKQLLHVAPIYKTYIKTLDSTQTFQAFQGGNPINMEMIGYPDELILNTHLIKL